MALNPHILESLLKGIKPGDAIASMGYPDILHPDIERLLGGKTVEYRRDSDIICKRHGVENHPIPDAESVFESFGASLDVFDVVQERGDEILVDLNYPVPSQACEQFEWVIDPGTLEHCFNIPQALINMACLLKVGGTVFHENPFNWGNHGFYNLNPTLFHDFYTDNGFELIECKLHLRGEARILDIPLTSRFVFKGGEANLVTRARRVEIKEMKFPTQTKYLKALG